VEGLAETNRESSFAWGVCRPPVLRCSQWAENACRRYDGYGGGTAGGRRDIPYDGSMASSSVAGSSEAYIATAMPNETKTNEASRQKGLTPIQRAAKRAMERDNPYIPLSDLIPAYHENPEGLKKALNTPIP